MKAKLIRYAVALVLGAMLAGPFIGSASSRQPTGFEPVHNSAQPSGFGD